MVEKCVNHQAALYIKDLLPFITHTKSQYFQDILAQQDALQHTGGQGTGDSDYKGDEDDKLMEHDEEHRALLIPSRKRFHNRFRGLMNTRVLEPPARLVFIKQRAGGSETLVYRISDSGIRYSPAALYRFHAESVQEPVLTVPPAQETSSLNTFTFPAHQY
ncbi:hypothetical protein E2C01_012062 [Portunus trituberculatus]|uniref:Uncharacterized protein n=1 Tax=Portunus trituberculatus TaxID=210409 RepID=A0A5B7DCH7_PORTR|nr:hypothetical protein [Portunus trituberculatus]